MQSSRRTARWRAPSSAPQGGEMDSDDDDDAAFASRCRHRGGNKRNAQVDLPMQRAAAKLGHEILWW